MITLAIQAWFQLFALLFLIKYPGMPYLIQCGLMTIIICAPLVPAAWSAWKAQPTHDKTTPRT